MILRKISFLLLPTVLTVIFFSCDNGKKVSDGSGGADSLLIKYNALIDSVDVNWAVMIADDDDKLVLMKRLLLEVSYTNNYDKAKYQELKEMVDQLKAMRYDQTTMINSSLIDAYDSATFAISDQIIEFARNHPRFDDIPLMEELIDDINGKNSYVLMHRIHYDNWVKELNSFKKNNLDKLLATDPVLETESMPLFELPS